MSGRETLVEIHDLPPWDAGAPSPVIVADAQSLHLAYYLPLPASDLLAPDRCGVVVFHGVSAHVFGAPNDEALSGHRLAPLGLKPYASYRVENSSWIADLRARNRVHPEHRDDRFDGLVHHVLTFHDSVLEVVAGSYSARIAEGRPLECLQSSFAARG